MVATTIVVLPSVPGVPVVVTPVVYDAAGELFALVENAKRWVPPEVLLESDWSKI